MAEVRRATGPGVHSARAGPALRQLAEADPAFAALSLWCDHRDDDAVGATPASSDHATIRYGPAFATLTLPEQVGVCAHHVAHVAFAHAARGRALALRLGERFNPALYQLCADAIVNQALMLAGYTLPRPAVELVPLLADAAGETTTATEALSRYDVERLYLQISASGGGGDGAAGGRRSESGRAGSASSEDEGTAAARARAYGDAHGFRPDMDLTGEMPSEAGPEAADWRQRVARALEEGRGAGRGIGRIGHRLADLPQVRTPWERRLRAMVAPALIHAPRQSHRRPSRPWLALDSAARTAGGPVPAFQPGTMPTRRAPRIAVALDSSASVDRPLLARFAAEIAGIGRRTGAELHLLAFDTEVRLRRRLTPGAWRQELADLRPARGGGTAFAPAIAEAAALSPSVIVVLTDLDGPPGPAPSVPLVWAVPGQAPARRPPFGRVVVLAG